MLAREHVQRPGPVSTSWQDCRSGCQWMRNDAPPCSGCDWFRAARAARSEAEAMAMHEHVTYRGR